MKKIYRFLIALPLIASLLAITSFKQSDGKGERLDFYQTYNDYLNGKVTSSWPDYVEDHDKIKVTFGPHEYYDWAATIDGKRVQGQWKDLDDWGYRDSKGALFRFGSKYAYGATRLPVVCTGKLWMYFTGCISFTGLNTLAKVIFVPTTAYGIYISYGGDVKVEEADMESQFKKYIKDDAAVLAKLKSDGGFHSYSKKEDVVLSDLNNAISWINQYNADHK